MSHRLFLIDTFTCRPFGGNPAPVVLLEDWPADETLRAIVGELGHLVAVFIRDKGDYSTIRVCVPQAFSLWVNEPY